MDSEAKGHSTTRMEGNRSKKALSPPAKDMRP
jgi:hypothetical protein